MTKISTAVAMTEAVAAMTDAAAKMHVNQIVQGLEKWVKDFDTAKAQFLSRLESNPTHALEWSGTLMSMSPRRDLAINKLEGINARRAAKDMTDKVIIATLMEVATNQVITRAGSTSRSTSPQANYINDETTRAWSELYQLAKWGQ